MITLFHNTEATGTLIQETEIPFDIPDKAILDLIITSSSEVNVFDIEFIVEVYEMNHWVIRDRTLISRDIDSPPFLLGTMRVQLYNIAGKLIRTTLNCGQSSLVVDATLVWQ